MTGPGRGKTVVGPGPLALGVGARADTPAADLAAAVAGALAAGGFPATDVGVLATVDRRAALLRPLATRHGWRLAAFRPADLAAVAVPHPSARTRDAVGTPSVAEAAALLAAGPRAVLVLPRRVLAGVTVAVAHSQACTGTLACICGR